MSQHYSEPERENDKWSLPDLETFYMESGEFTNADPDTWMAESVKDGNDPAYCEGWYYWFCFPGCLPEGNASGPFDTEDLALSEARETV